MQPNTPTPQPQAPQHIRPPQPAPQSQATEPTAPELVENIPLQQQVSTAAPAQPFGMPAAPTQNPAVAPKPAATPKPAKPPHPKPWLAILVALIFVAVLSGAAYYSFKN